MILQPSGELLKMDEAEIDICICTFRRDHLAETLKSLARLELAPALKIRIIVADNDETPGACELTQKMAAEIRLPVTYVHAPACNISVARNACLDAATAPFVAFIDDDEVAERQWLSALLTALKNNEADAAMGPVHAVYGPASPAWMRKGNFHSSFPVVNGGEIVTGGCGNVLIRREAPAVRGLRFRPELGRKGGEDSAFFSIIHKNGGRIVYAPEAVVLEAVTEERATADWLVRRRFRYGQTHGLLLLESSGSGIPTRIRNACAAATKAVICLGMALANIVRRERMMFWVLRGTLHAGVISCLFSPHKQETTG
jgi:succinoglycan biosynthesis protein ExoM